MAEVVVGYEEATSARISAQDQAVLKASTTIYSFSQSRKSLHNKLDYENDDEKDLT